MKSTRMPDNNKISGFYARYYYLIIVLLLLLALFLRLFRLGELPRGLHVDEVGMAYDAWSISEFGVDRYLKSLPVYLTNFGGGQSVMYCYLTALLFKLGAPTISVIIRLPGVVMSMVTGIFGFLLIRKMRGREAGLLFLIIYLTVPYFTQASRVALDCNLMLGMSVLMLYVLQKCLDTENEQTISCFIILGIITGMTFYTYALSYVVIPLFYLGVGVIMLICRHKIRLKEIFAFMIPVIIIAIPLVFVQIVNMFDLDEFKIFNLTITKLIYYRGNEISLSEIGDNIRWIYRSIFTADNTEFDTFRQFGALYIFSLPVIIGGGIITVIRSIKEAKKGRILFDGLILLYTVTVLFAALFIQGVTTYRINSVFFGLAFLITIVLECLTVDLPGRMDRRTSGNVIRGAGIALTALYIVSSVFYLRYYFCKYEDDIYPQRLFAEDPAEAFCYVESQPDDIRNRLTYVGGVDEAYVYYMLSMHIPPYDYDTATYGNNGDGIRYTFYTRSPYDMNSNYIMYVPEDEATEELLSAGFTETDFGPYRVFIHGE